VCRLTRQRAPRAEGAQFVTRHGEEVAVVLNIAEYRRMSGAAVDLKDYLRSAPDLDALEIVRATRTRLPGRLGGSVMRFYFQIVQRVCYTSRYPGYLYTC
jgi:prevent-host-death family protein